MNGFTYRPSAWALASHAWKSVADAARQMMPLFVLLLALAFGQHLVIATVFTRGGPGALWQPGGATIFILRGLTVLLTNSAVATPCAIVIHRFIMLHEKAPMRSWNGDYWMPFYLWMAAIQFAMFVAQMPFRFALDSLYSRYYVYAQGTLQLGWLYFLPAFVAAIASVYLAMLFPDIAIGAACTTWRERGLKSIHRMQGNFWLFFFAGILAFLPIYVVLLGLAFLLPQIVSGLGAGHHDLSLVRFMIPGLDALGTLLGVSLAAAIASWLYTWARSQP
jgi:hypothetical protein